MRVKLNVTGIVQGVGFRPFVYRTAVANGLTGYVRNLGDAGVEVLVEGKAQSINNFLNALTAKKPPLAKIQAVKTSELLGENDYINFSILDSSQEAKQSGSIIPPDVAICNPCLQDLRDPQNPRYNYFFITCTDCGPRFTTIERLPYDRVNTTMKEFSMCSFCRREYREPANRRFHAQTIADLTCGPKAFLTTNDGELFKVADPIREAGKLLSKGKILAIKGYGGFHIAASTMLEEPLLRLRKTKHRGEKPFAIMAKSLEAVKTVTEVKAKEQELLISSARPIVLLNKNGNYNLSPLVAPHLHNVGVMLPYTGLHYMLFDNVADTSFVLTSANPPNQPIMKDDEEAYKNLGGSVDYFLFHNRQIAHRCDDSVMRVHGSHPVFIRRSRGYAPAPLRLKQKSKYCTIGLGGELNNTSCLLLEDKAFISQHIGDVENIETRNFLSEATEHLQRLTNSHAEVVACDLHPKFATTYLAKEMAEIHGLPLVQIQHHHAHASALMAENGLDEIVAITCDGYGYGSDGKAWGGEILHCIQGSREFNRLAHLEPQLLLGGDIASRYPLRLTAAMLSKTDVDIENWLLKNSVHLPHGAVEARLIADQLKLGMGIETTSCGRVMDAVSALLGLCNMRSYEGEPAMKLESAAAAGVDALKLKPQIRGSVLQTTCLIKEVFDSLGKVNVADLAYSAHVYMAKGLAELAIQNATSEGVKTVGLTGGAACNQILALLMRQKVGSAGLQFVAHVALPAGDGGVSFGQTIVAGFGDF